MVAHRVARVFLASLAAAVVILVGAGASASVAAPASRVLSDRAGAAGSGKREMRKGSFTFNSVQCDLRSVDEPSLFHCKLSGHLTRSAAGQMSGTAKLVSTDSIIRWTFTLTPAGTPGTYRMRGAGSELDQPDPGQPPGQAIPCTVTGVVGSGPNPSGFSFKASMAVFEEG
jgi:hypothetical protein